jgi:hypothetical protein
MVPAAPDTAWFLVGGTKLIVMCVATFGLYEIYWFYQQWQHVRRRSGESLQPALRTFFAGLFCYSLFRRVAESAAARDLPAPSPIWTTVVFIALSVTWQFPEPWRFLSLLSLGPLVLVQRAASAVAVAETPAADRNTRLTPLNWFGVGVFTVLILLVVLGALLPPVPPVPGAAPKPTATARSGQGDLQPGDGRGREAVHQYAALDAADRGVLDAHRVRLGEGVVRVDVGRGDLRALDGTGRGAAHGDLDLLRLGDVRVGHGQRQ